MTTLQTNRHGLELLEIFHDGDTRREAIITSFTTRLGGYLETMLEPETSEAEVLRSRERAIGILDTLRDMGLDMAEVREVAVGKAAREKVKVNLGY